jgi:hypothetical protein
MLRRSFRRSSPALPFAAVALAAGALALAEACGSNGIVTYDPGLDADILGDAPTRGTSVGGRCDALHFCRPGLGCVDGACAAAHDRPDGAACVISAECTRGSYCGGGRTCIPGGAGEPGAPCASDGDCATGARCDLVGLHAACRPEGAADVDAACRTSADCFGGLTCAAKVCVPLPRVTGTPPVDVPLWPGVDCADEAGPTLAYFRVPRGAEDGDFFRLPFPNDVRMKAGHPALSGFPTPGDALLGFDLVDRYARDVEQSTDGWSPYPTVTLRFSAPVDFDSLKAAGVLQWIELDPSTGGGTPIGFTWGATTGRSPYVCANALSARPPMGQPLKPGTAYAFIVTTAARDAAKQPIAVAPDLQALLASTAPTDGALTDAYAAYAPLRAYAAKAGVAAKILNATLFTVGHPAAAAASLLRAVSSAAVPTARGWTKCGSGAPSPCDDATGDRACGAPDPSFDELHARVTLPIFQVGTAPYATPAAGGDIALDPAGARAPVVQRTEEVCLALTVPTTPMPASGFPVVVYAHATGGSFRSHVTDGVAALLATAKDAAGVTVPTAVIGIDQVQHGPRRGASLEPPANLYFNFANPLAARGNVLQSAADQASLARFVAGLSVPPDVAGRVTTFASIAFWGHGQGATAGALALPYTPGVLGAVLSGAGASYVDLAVTKRNPIDVADVAPTALGERALGTYHPALALIQSALDAADPIHHAALLAARPLAPLRAKHVFQPHGTRDSYTPRDAQVTYALAAQLGLAAQPSTTTDPDGMAGVTPTPVPASGNLLDPSGRVTAFVREYSPNLYDGHFVAFRDPTARRDVAAFLAAVVSGKVPSVGQP